MLVLEEEDAMQLRDHAGLLAHLKNVDAVKDREAGARTALDMLVEASKVFLLGILHSKIQTGSNFVCELRKQHEEDSPAYSQVTARESYCVSVLQL